jgi:hypothetical protein
MKAEKTNPCLKSTAKTFYFRHLANNKSTYTFIKGFYQEMDFEALEGMFIDRQD